MKKKIALSVIFDENYVEPALVTIFDLVRFAPADFDIFLVYMESSNAEVNTDITNLVTNAINSISSTNKVSAIKFKSKIFDRFEKYHFTNSILYKLILPELLQHDYIVNIDAGFLSGSEIDKLFEYLLSVVAEPQFSSSCAVGSVCFPSPKDLPAELSVLKHNKLYPTGGILLFNCENYRKSKLFDRLSSGYSLHKDQLVWAEQDLLCLIAEEGELHSLDLHGGILTENLSIQGYLQFESSIALSSTFMLYKVTGTLKPWKSWVFDPKKKFYLDRRESVMKNLNFSDSSVVLNNRFQVTHQPLYRAFLSAFEQKLIDS